MTSPTLARGLRQPTSMAAKLRALRLRKKMRLVELAAAHRPVGRDAVETRTRRALSHAADAAADCAGLRRRPRSLLHRRRRRRRRSGIVRKRERTRFTERLGGREVAWEFECLDFAATERKLNAYWVRFHAP